MRDNFRVEISMLDGWTGIKEYGSERTGSTSQGANMGKTGKIFVCSRCSEFGVEGEGNWSKGR